MKSNQELCRVKGIIYNLLPQFYQDIQLPWSNPTAAWGKEDLDTPRRQDNQVCQQPAPVSSGMLMTH